MLLDKAEYLKVIEKLNQDIKGSRPDPHSLSKIGLEAESAFAQDDASRYRKALERVKKDIALAEETIWVIENVWQKSEKYKNDKIYKKGVDQHRADAVKGLKKLKDQKRRLETEGEARARLLERTSAMYTRYKDYQMEGKQYEFYLNDMLFPVAPASLEVKIKDQNDKISLADGGELLVLQKPGLTEISFTALLPSDNYPWAQYIGGFKPAQYFLGRIEEMKTSGQAVDFAVIRNYDNSAESDTFMRVGLADYTIKEDAERLVDDMEVKIDLVQFNELKSEIVRIEDDGKGGRKASITKGRPDGAGVPKVPCAHLVFPGETLSQLARYYYGDSSLWKVIAKENDMEKNPNTLKGKKYLWIREPTEKEHTAISRNAIGLSKYRE